MPPREYIAIRVSAAEEFLFAPEFNVANARATVLAYRRARLQDFADRYIEGTDYDILEALNTIIAPSGVFHHLPPLHLNAPRITVHNNVPVDSLAEFEILFEPAIIPFDAPPRTTERCEDVAIGFVDTGVSDHPEFQPDQLTQADFSSIGRIASRSVSDNSGHGTFVAALAAGRTKGWAPGARVAMASVFGGGSAYLLTVLGALNWLAVTPFGAVEGRPGVDVMNVSAGTKRRDAIYYPFYLELRRLGIVTVAAIGNQGRTNGEDTDSPANYDNVIGVGSTILKNGVQKFYADGTDRGFVNQLMKPDVCTIGVGVESAVENGYTKQTGTSYAAGSVSGMCARFIHLHGLRDQPRQIEVALRERCVRDADWQGSEWGYVDLEELERLMP